MITKVDIENFKCFRTIEMIEMSEITVCTGLNSVGKSTLVQALLLAKQCCANYNTTMRVLLNTDALKLGTTSSICITENATIISLNGKTIALRSNNDKLSFTILMDEGAKHLFDESIESIFLKEFYYLNAERLGPRNYQEIVSHDTPHCGFFGEYTFALINKHADRTVRANRLFMGGTLRVPDLGKQIDYWMQYIVNGVEISFSNDDSVQLSMMKIKQPDLDTPFGSPNNFGFGISYVLPIIATGLFAGEQSMVIVENPEAHLHPAGQSRIGEFLARISNDGVQVIVETHSEHVINGIRKYLLLNDLSPESICLNYFSIDNKTGQHNVERLKLNTNMDILKWPDGFFDQEEKDLQALIAARRAKR